MAKKLALTLLLFVLTALTACAANNTGSTDNANNTDAASDTADKVYVMTQNGLQGVVKANGTVLPIFFKPIYGNLSVLTDDFTHEQKYIVSTKMAAGPDRDQYGMPTEAIYTCGLYDLSGKQIGPDLQNLFYSDPVGDYIAVTENNYSGGVNAHNGGYFINLKTNQTSYHGITNFAVSKHTLLAYFDQTKQAILFDASLKPIKTFNDVKSIFALDAIDDCYTITNQERLVSVINGQGKQVLPYQRNSFYAINTHYLLTDSGTKVLDLTGHGLMRSAPGYEFSYYDGKTAVWTVLNENRVVLKQYLVNMTGKIISRAYDYIETGGKFSQAGQAPVFVGFVNVSQEGNNTINKLDIMDATGNVLYSAENCGFWRYVTPDCFILTQAVAGVNHTKVINLAGQEVIPARQNTNIDFLYDQAGQQSPPYLVAQYTNSQGTNLYDIYHLDGQLVLKGLNGVGYCDGQVISVSKGFDTGLMDMQGHWLYKQSIFAGLNIDN